jgi:hypothetical protein
MMERGLFAYFGCFVVKLGFFRHFSPCTRRLGRQALALTPSARLPMAKALVPASLADVRGVQAPELLASAHALLPQATVPTADFMPCWRILSSDSADFRQFDGFYLRPSVSSADEPPWAGQRPFSPRMGTPTERWKKMSGFF